MLLHAERALFSGGHLAWSPERATLTAFPDACWYSWAEQIASMVAPREHRFERVLPGHGHRGSPPHMRAHLERCITWMKTV